MKRLHLLQAASLLLCALGCAPAQSQATWPERPIKLLVGYPAGGPVDATGRIFARFLAEQLNASVVVENKAGASGMIAADFTSKAAPDGYTLNFVASPSMTITPVVQRSTLFDPRKDFTLIGGVVQYANVLLIGPQIPAKTVAELVAYAKANPEKEMLHVPYKGNSPAMMDVVSGKITFMFDIIGTGRNFIESGQARGLAVTSKTRNPSIPNVPTMIEAGIPGYEVVGWFAVIGPLKMPEPVVTKLRTALESVRKNPAFRKAVEDVGYIVDDGVGAVELAARIGSEYVMWQGVVQKGNILPQ